MPAGYRILIGVIFLLAINKNNGFHSILEANYFNNNNLITSNFFAKTLN